MSSGNDVQTDPELSDASRLGGDASSAPSGAHFLSRLQRYCLAPILAVGLLTILVLWVFHLQLFDGWSFPWDFLDGGTAEPAFVAATIGRGHPLFWSPFVASGFPVATDPQAGMYFLGWWALGVLRIPATLQVLITVQVLHVLLGAVGMMALARARRLKWPWATLAGVAYVFFGGFYGQAEHTGFFRGFGYLPWLLWALTPPTADRRWLRLAIVPLIAWLIITGAYPGEIASFGITGLVYLAVSLRSDHWRRLYQYRSALLLAGLACAAIAIAALLPYLHAEHAGELYRTIEPTATERSAFSLAPLDLFGLYLNNFAWTYEGTITTWAVGIPIIVGLALGTSQTFKRHAPLVVCGAVAMFLAMAPKIGFIGRIMAGDLRPLFPSRFPAADYKAVIAVTLIVLSVDAWSTLAARQRERPWSRVLFVSCILIVGALLVPTTYARPTRELWLLVTVVVISAALALKRPSTRALASLLIVLVIVDGVREINDYLLAGTNSPWKVPPSALAFYQRRDAYVRKLPQRLAEAVKSRPARAPAAATAEENASGWVADAYHETDYDPTIERVLWEAEHNPAWSKLLLEPWHAYVFSCVSVGCKNGKVRLPPPTKWRPSPAVQTLSYGDERITYIVRVAQPVLMVENELANNGWKANTTKVRGVRAGIPLRAWRLAPGRYEFVAFFEEPDQDLQILAGIVALVAWLGCVFLIVRIAAGEKSQSYTGHIGVTP